MTDPTSAAGCARRRPSPSPHLTAALLSTPPAAVLEFLRGLMVPGADNQLEKFLLRVLSCNEMTAALRVNTLWHYIFSRPARFLAGSSRKLHNWSIDSSSRVMDLIEKAMVEVAADGHTLLDPSFDPFASIAAEQPTAGGDGRPTRRCACYVAACSEWRRDTLVRSDVG